MTQGDTRSIRARLALFATMTMLWTLLGIAGPVQA